MLETAIEKLHDAIVAMTDSLDRQTAILQRFEDMSKEAGRKSLADSAAKWEAEGLKVPEDINAADDAAREALQAKRNAAKAEAAEAQPVASTISRDDLQAKCMSIVRADRKKRANVEAIIAEYGATLIRDVPEDKLAEVAVKLNELEAA